jgi:hypothetical protein
MVNGDDVGDITAASQSCITAFKGLLQYRTTELTDTEIGIERNSPPITRGVPGNQQFSKTNESYGPSGLHHQGLPIQSSKATLPSHEIEIAFARFKIWGSNLGAMQRGSSSLDVRLRDSSVMRIAIIRILSSLRETLDECEFVPYF